MFGLVDDGLPATLNSLFSLGDLIFLLKFQSGEHLSQNQLSDPSTAPPHPQIESLMIERAKRKISLYYVPSDVFR